MRSAKLIRPYVQTVVVASTKASTESNYSKDI